MIRRRPMALVALKRKHAWPGLGVLNYYDLLAQANLQNCAPMDSACVSNNVAKEAAVEDFWAAHQSTGVPDDTRLTFTPQTAAQVQEFYNPQDIFNSGNVVDTRGIMQITGTFQGNDPLPPVRTMTPAVPVKAAITPQGQTVINSSGALQPSGAAPVPGLSLSSIPWWGWLAGGGALLFAFGGNRGR